MFDLNDVIDGLSGLFGGRRREQELALEQERTRQAELNSTNDNMDKAIFFGGFSMLVLVALKILKVI